MSAGAGPIAEECVCPFLPQDIARKCPLAHRNKVTAALKEFYAQIEKKNYHQRSDYYAQNKLGNVCVENLWRFKEEVLFLCLDHSKFDPVLPGSRAVAGCLMSPHQQLLQSPKLQCLAA